MAKKEKEDTEDRGDETTDEVVELSPEEQLVLLSQQLKSNKRKLVLLMVLV